MKIITRKQMQSNFKLICDYFDSKGFNFFECENYIKYFFKTKHGLFTFSLHKSDLLCSNYCISVFGRFDTYTPQGKTNSKNNFHSFDLNNILRQIDFFVCEYEVKLSSKL